MKYEYIARNRAIMFDAWIIMRNSDNGKSDALRRAWLISRLDSRLKRGERVKFAFIKANGEFRNAVGMSAATGSQFVIGTGAKPKPYNFLYWDCEKSGFRQFAKSRIVAVYADNVAVETTRVA